jgi:hypothetical protein
VSPDPYWIASPPAGPILQTELLSNVVEFRVKIETIGTPDEQFEEFRHPLVIVMTQDCDVDLDHKARYEGGAAHRQIDSVLVCEADDATAMKGRGGLDSKRWGQVLSHQNERYQVLGAVPAVIAEAHALPADPAGGSRLASKTASTDPPSGGWRRWLARLSRSRQKSPRPVVVVGRGPVLLDARFRGTIGLDFRRVFTMPTPELYRRIEIGEARRHCYLSSIYRDHLSNRFYGYQMRVALPEGEE